MITDMELMFPTLFKKKAPLSNPICPVFFLDAPPEMLAREEPDSRDIGVDTELDKALEEFYHLLKDDSGE